MEKKQHNLKERVSKGEKIGGGFIVVGRHSTTGRVRVSVTGMPFEHPTLEAAAIEAARLADLYVGKRYCVFQQMVDFCRPVETTAMAAE